MSEKLLESANELRTINKPLLQLTNEFYSSNELYTLSQRCLQSMNQLRTCNEQLVNNDRYQTMIIIIWFPSFFASYSLIESQRQLALQN